MVAPRHGTSTCHLAFQRIPAACPLRLLSPPPGTPPPTPCTQPAPCPCKRGAVVGGEELHSVAARAGRAAPRSASRAQASPPAPATRATARQRRRERRRRRPRPRRRTSRWPSLAGWSRLQRRGPSWWRQRTSRRALWWRNAAPHVGAHSLARRAHERLPAPRRPLLQAPSGQLLPINVLRPPSAADVFRCTGCVRPECQGPSGCAAAELAWRREPDGYLKQILTARVYKIAVETPLQQAKGLSRQLGSEIWLKREDLQVRRAAAGGRSGSPAFQARPPTPPAARRAAGAVVQGAWRVQQDEQAHAGAA